MESIKKEAEESGRGEIDVMIEAMNVGVAYIRARRETENLNIASAAITVEEITFMTNLIMNDEATLAEASE